MSRSRCRCCQTREWALCFKGVLSLRNDCRGRQIFSRSCLSFLALFCLNKLSGCPQCGQTDGKTVKTVKAASRFPSIRAETTPARLVSLQTIAYIQALGIQSLSYTMALKPLAAKAFVFNRNFVNDVVSRDETRLLRRRILPRFSPLCLWQHRRWAWRVHLCFVRTSPTGGTSSKEMSSTRLRRGSRRQPLLANSRGEWRPPC